MGPSHTIFFRRHWPQCRRGCLRQDLLWPRPLTFDFQNLIRSSLGAAEYFRSVLPKLLKPFLRYRGHNICPDEWLDERTRWTDSLKTTPSLTMPRGKGVKRQVVCFVLFVIFLQVQTYAMTCFLTCVYDGLLKTRLKNDGPNSKKLKLHT